MKIMMITTMWPTPVHQWSGTFVQREVEGLRQINDLEVEVVHVQTAEARWRYVACWANVRRSLARSRPNIVHFHYGLSQALAPWWRGPSAVTFHGSDLMIPWQRALSTGLLRTRASRAAIVVAADLLEHLQPGSRVVRVIPCGVDAARFRPMDKTVARHLLRIDRDRPVLLFPASPARQVKNYPLFRETVERLRYEHAVDATEIRLDDVSPADAPAMYGAADVVLVTSHREGSPMVVKEALACGRPVVSTPVGDVLGYTQGALPCAVSNGWNAGELARLVVQALRMPAWPQDAVEPPTVDDEVTALLEAYEAIL